MAPNHLAQLFELQRCVLVALFCPTAAALSNCNRTFRCQAKPPTEEAAGRAKKIRILLDLHNDNPKPRACQSGSYITRSLNLRCTNPGLLLDHQRVASIRSYSDNTYGLQELNRYPKLPGALEVVPRTFNNQEVFFLGTSKFHRCHSRSS